MCRIFSLFRLGALAAMVAGSCTASTVQAAVVAYWEFEPGNLTTDSSGNGNTLSNTNVVSSLDVPGNVSNGSASFNGSNAFMKTASLLNLSSANQLTVEMFYKPDGNFAGGGSANILFEHSSDFNSFNGGLVAYGVNSGSSNNIEAGYNASGYHATRATGVPVAGWHHVAVQFDRATAVDNDVVKIFVDYVQVDVPFLTNPNRTAFLNDTLFIGARNGTGIFYDGLIDQLRISDTLLSPSEFLQAEVAVPAPEPTGLALLGLGCVILRSAARRKK